MSNYDKYPEIKVKGFDNCAWQGYDEICNAIKEKIANKNKTTIVIDFYPGVNGKEVLNAFKTLSPTLIIRSDDCAYDGETITNMMKDDLTDDRIFGSLTTKKLENYFIDEKINESRDKINKIENGICLVYGVGASLITTGDLLIYADLARWEIQTRYKNGMPNWKQDNHNEDFQRKYKRGYFVEWRLADRHKKYLYEQIDFLLDTNIEGQPKMITGEAFREGLKHVVRNPFRLVPTFNPGVWGGQWLKEVCDLDKDVENFAWCFDCIPEENSIYLKYGNIRVEVPSINVIFYKPVDFLGNKVHGRFGHEFPIRFNILDTMQGQNLSLQVHPLTEYIQENFGIHYTQDESYYILDSTEDALVYLGLKEGINKDDMLKDLRKAEKGEIEFPAEEYVETFPAKKHSHFSIPGGTIHCSGSNCVVLEISSCQYNFTFKLWDWGRVGLDGLPRPIHIDHGEKNIQWDRTKKWVEENLIDNVEVLSQSKGSIEERTGLHEREFIETIRNWFTEPVLHDTKGNVNVLNLIEGEEAIVESPNNSFEPLIVHYAETFIIPASVGQYIIRPYGKSLGKEIATIKAYVRC